VQLPWLIYLLTALALVVVVLTRVRLRGSRRRVGRLQTSPVVLHVHTVAGLLGVGTWTAFLLSGIGEGKGDSEVGIVALGLLWVTVVAGLMILVGFYTRPAAFIASGTMAVAYFMMHAPQSFFPSNNAGDAPILFCFVFLYLVFSGPGAWSANKN